MPSKLSFALSAFTVISTALAFPTKRTTYPFSKIVAFGDEFSDNGNGSYAHGVTGDPAFVYGFNTWTNGPVAVSFLSTLLNAELTDYAFGGNNGGENFGATFDNSYTANAFGAPSVKDQIANYSGSGYTNIKDSLGFIWVGQNDVTKHTDAFWETDPQNAAFADEAAKYTSGYVSELIDAGAPYVFVANIYPKHKAPVTATYLCGTNTACVETWGNVISATNTAIKNSLTSFGDKVIYYDAFAFVTSLFDDAKQKEIECTQPLTAFCDHGADSECLYNNATGYFWMNYVQPVAMVHELIAKDMQSTIDAHFSS